MPPVRFWFIILRAVIVTFAGVLTTQLVQLSGTSTRIAASTWLTALLTAAVAGANAGHAAWPEDAPPQRSAREEVS